ncbi:hypothetical protein P171DRAFT_477297 [Karstenula rhodostoma CBS 690.94]|uniref:JmjC domain-containing protein n=1 Tax=Karstenula rhodostoma CBS 690.94 TaxID=1392251 RepID=A0A9P4P4V6_9PLEO|nr:hypothetical protein P171DRAFT_477297 [Karstenula rhodostoma CBS 690.94]
MHSPLYQGLRSRRMVRHLVNYMSSKSSPPSTVIFNAREQARRSDQRLKEAISPAEYQLPDMAEKLKARTPRRIGTQTKKEPTIQKLPSGESPEFQAHNTLDGIETMPANWREALRRHYAEKPQNHHLDMYIQAIARCERTISHRQGDSPSFPIHEPCVVAANGWVKSKTPDKLSVRSAIFESMLFSKSNGGRRARVGVQGTVGRAKDLDVNMMQNFWCPDPSTAPDNIRYAIDVKGFENTVECRLPEVVTNVLRYDETHLIPAANVTPKYTCVDMHSDGSLHVWTVCDAPKLWVFWPPTDRNLKHFCARRSSAKILSQLWDKLEGGQYALTMGGEGMYIPPRWLHATYSIESSVPTGFTFSSAESLEAATCTMQQDLDRRNPGGHPDIEVVTWLQSLKLAVEVDSREGHQACFDSIQKFCYKKEMTEEGIEDLIGSGEQDMVKLIVKAFESWGGKWSLTQQCHSCQQEIRTHLPFENAASSRANRARQRMEPAPANMGTSETNGGAAEVDGARKRRRKE